MVQSDIARADIDSALLTKTITLQSVSYSVSDLANDERTETYTSVNVPAQVTVQTMDSEFVKEGLLLKGDLVGLFRYEYSKDITGATITPTIVPKKNDKFVFLGNTFLVKECTPATSEDSAIIGWDFKASRIK